MRSGQRSGPRRVAVIGGTGWVGRHVSEAFERHGHEVLVLARGAAPWTRGLRFRALDLVAAPVRELVETLREEQVDVVVNATDGANARDGWKRTEAEFTAANVDAVRRLVEAVATLPGRPRLVHIGTVHEYGPVEAGVLLHEAVEPRPANAYARTKLAGSRAVLDAAREGAVDGVVLRLANACGPHPSPASFPGMLLRLFRDAAAGGEAVVRVTGAQLDFVDVRDAADAVLRAATAADAVGRAVNIGSGVAVPVRTLVAMMVAVTGVPSDAVREDRGPATRLGGDWVRVDNRLAARLLGWRPRFSLEDSLRAMWRAGVTGSRDAPDRGGLPSR